ncbi:hypothetical protein BCR39DRAFT_539550 [Naematelia encephala]|uniref:Uncharacterized protein n=1 Tax=Naematelia encephala TaxID=71784 RepID=A0A1Y2AWL2_9TREE|nr:hypothetical protein BCR39DRAFT_539550 [Naematelia encephala]
MSSPIHKYLFSPPPSPPRRPADLESGILPSSTRLTSLKTLLLPVDLIPRASLDAPALSELKPRSPRTPQNNQFTFDTTFPSRRSMQIDVEKSPRNLSPGTFETPRRKTEKTIASPPYLPTNVPSVPGAIPSTLPRPLLRLIFLASLLLSSALLLILVPAARLPSLRAASVSRRLALDEDGRAYYDINHKVGSFEEARDRDYTPPQIRVPKLSKRAVVPPGALELLTAGPPRTTRPAAGPRPLPSSHELLALQSYLLQSDYNILPQFTDPGAPLDANAVLSVGSHHLGKPGSAEEDAWLAELEAEHADNIVVWYGGNGVAQSPVEILSTLESIHGPTKKPTLIPCHGRADLALLRSIFNRFGVDIQRHPLIMIGTEPVVGDAEVLEEMSNSGRLNEMLAKIGWGKKETDKNAWKPKVAKVEKRELTEIELALKKR